MKNRNDQMPKQGRGTGIVLINFEVYKPDNSNFKRRYLSLQIARGLS